MSLIVEILLPPFVACLILTGIHTYLGLHVVSRGVIFVDLALAQIAALGATFAFLLGYPPHGTFGYLFSLAFAFVGAAVFSLSRLKDQRVPQEAIIGISFAVASAAAILIADRAPEGSEFVEAMLTGALLWVPWTTIAKTAVLYSLVGLFHWRYRRRFLALSLEPERAAAEGWSVRWWDFLFYMSFGFVITSSVAIAGVLLVFSFLVIPSVIAMLFAREIRSRLAIGWIVGTFVSTLGLALSYRYDLPSGPAVVVTFGATLAAAATLRYLMRAERPAVALARVATAVIVVGVALWLAVRTSPAAQVATGHAEAAAAAEQTPRFDAAGAAPAPGSSEQILAAFAALEQRQGPASADTVAVLRDAGEQVHALLLSGELQPDEQDVEAITAGLPSDVAHGLLEEFAHHAGDAWVRLRAAQELLEMNDLEGGDALVEILASDMPALVRSEAMQRLRATAGTDFGYDPMLPAAEQGEAIASWRAWLRDRAAGDAGAR